MPVGPRAAGPTPQGAACGFFWELCLGWRAAWGRTRAASPPAPLAAPALGSPRSQWPGARPTASPFPQCYFWPANSGVRARCDLCASFINERGAVPAPWHQGGALLCPKHVAVAAPGPAGPRSAAGCSRGAQVTGEAPAQRLRFSLTTEPRGKRRCPRRGSRPRRWAHGSPGLTAATGAGGGCARGSAVS